VVLVGDPGVGKTNLLATFLAEDAVNDDGVSRTFSTIRKPTIGVEFATAIVRHPNGKRLKAQIWDTGTSFTRALRRKPMQ
jgi:GTPase SAR1 family protein